jgi:ABC-type Zn uptake system ZnuABC Zn-binding protein ZnuA
MLINSKRFYLSIIVIALLSLAAQCGSNQPDSSSTLETMEFSAIELADGEKLNIVATTNIVADIVRNVGGDKINLTELLLVGTDPHTFEPTPSDVAMVADAHAIFVNGFGLELFLDELIRNAGEQVIVISVSSGIERTNDDPHLWMAVDNVLVFVQNIEQALSKLDPANAETYQTNAAMYTAQLIELDSWVKAQIATIPTENRKMVTDHEAFGYYADRYGLEIIGAVIPAYSTNASPSARDLAALQEIIEQHKVKAIFVSIKANPTLAKRLAEDTGIQLVGLYAGSLGEAGSGAENYIDYIRYNTKAIVKALGK